MNWLSLSVSVMLSSHENTVAYSVVWILPFLKMLPLEDEMTSRYIFFSSISVIRSLCSCTDSVVA